MNIQLAKMCRSSQVCKVILFDEKLRKNVIQGHFARANLFAQVVFFAPHRIKHKIPKQYKSNFFGCILCNVYSGYFFKGGIEIQTKYLNVS